MTRRHLDRLRRARDLLTAKGFDARDAVLACYSGNGFDGDLRSASRRGDVTLVGVADLY
jgi:uncharacterized protein